MDRARARRAHDPRPRRAVEPRRDRARPRCGEVAGGTAAECVAVCCCFPLGVIELVVLAAVRAPAAMLRRSVTARRRRRRRVPARRSRKEEEEEEETGDLDGAVCKAGRKEEEYWSVTCHPTDEAAEAEKEVWAGFQGAGFWRSPSQREVCKG